jgi:two-component system, NarL family, sensor kinase
MTGEKRIQELITLKIIAETLNQSNDLDDMLNTVLGKLLELTRLTTGWIFIPKERTSFECHADHGLPPALSWEDKTPMRMGSCWCLERFWDGRLKHAVNILSCKRLEDAVRYQWGDTMGITHHATIPLRVGGQLFGILNVAAPGKQSFDEDELALLHSVALQIGTAVERIRLFQLEERRADKYRLLGEFTRKLAIAKQAEEIPRLLVAEASSLFSWPTVGLSLVEGSQLSLRALSRSGEVCAGWMKQQPWTEHTDDPAHRVWERKEARLFERASIPSHDPSSPFYQMTTVIAAPIQLREEVVGVIYAGALESSALDRVDLEVLTAIADHAALAFDDARLNEQRRDLARWEERNRLARDLHDSVSQLLFSLNMTAKGLEGLAPGLPKLALEAVQDIQKLSQQALSEMRGLISNLRPQGLEEGLVTGLRQYGQTLGLRVETEVEGIPRLPHRTEETLWRIGQEALNNARKHAGVHEVHAHFKVSSSSAELWIRDEGIGFSAQDITDAGLGLASMRERAEALGGTLKLISEVGKGTTVHAWIPIEWRERKLK